MSEADPIRMPVIAGNWKMHKGPGEARAFVREFADRYAASDERTVLLFPPAVSLAATAELASARTDIRVGAQNIHWEDAGAFTGETSGPMARDAGAELTLVGHSERRHVFGETDEQTGRKVAAAVEFGLLPVLCVGEKLMERQAGHVEAVITQQLDRGLAGIDDEAVGRMLIAYEPVWAIGTGETATPEDAAEAHGVLRARLAERIGAEAAGRVPILYGGSVKPHNAAELLAADDVDGVLVGGASLDPESFAAIATAG